MKWFIEEALFLIRESQGRAMADGYYLALAGGVLNAGHSINDLDLVAVPRTENSNSDFFIKRTLPALFGPLLSSEAVPKGVVCKFQINLSPLEVVVIT